MLEDLPISFGLEVLVGQRMLGIYHRPIVGERCEMRGTGCWVELRGVLHLRMDVDEFAYLLPDSLVEINEELIALFEEWTKVVGIIVEERTLAIG